jgi:hypothetical protein
MCKPALVLRICPPSDHVIRLKAASVVEKCITSRTLVGLSVPVQDWRACLAAPGGQPPGPAA